jgi:hypothetical protein
MLPSWRSPIGIEPITYVLREGSSLIQKRSSPPVWPSGSPPLAKITLRDGSLPGSHVSRTRDAQTVAFHEPGRQHPCRMALPAPRGHDVIADVTSDFSELGRQLVPDHQGPQVVLAGDVPEDRGRHSPPCSHPSPRGDELGEVLAGWSQPICRRAPEQAIGLLAHEVGRPHGGCRSHQPWLLKKADHNSGFCQAETWE